MLMGPITLENIVVYFLIIFLRIYPFLGHYRTEQTVADPAKKTQKS